MPCAPGPRAHVWVTGVPTSRTTFSLLVRWSHALARPSAVTLLSPLAGAAKPKTSLAFSGDADTVLPELLLSSSPPTCGSIFRSWGSNSSPQTPRPCPASQSFCPLPFGLAVPALSFAASLCLAPHLHGVSLVGASAHLGFQEADDLVAHHRGARARLRVDRCVRSSGEPISCKRPTRMSSRSSLFLLSDTLRSVYRRQSYSQCSISESLSDTLHCAGFSTF